MKKLTKFGFLSNKCEGVFGKMIENIYHRGRNYWTSALQLQVNFKIQVNINVINDKVTNY